MTEDSNLAEQVEWFHQFAGQTLSELADQASEINRKAIARLVETCLPGYNAPAGQSPEEFASTVQELRANERQWNQALCAALIQADDLLKSEGSQAAAARLKAFASSCPWKLFREVANNQAANYNPYA
jgi:hypothetical protein